VRLLTSCILGTLLVAAGGCAAAPSSSSIPAAQAQATLLPNLAVQAGSAADQAKASKLASNAPANLTIPWGKWSPVFWAAEAGDKKQIEFYDDAKDSLSKAGEFECSEPDHQPRPREIALVRVESDAAGKATFKIWPQSTDPDWEKCALHIGDGQNGTPLTINLLIELER